MMNEHTRAALAQRQILLHLIRRHPGMTDAEISTLTELAVESAAVQSYVLGAESTLAIGEAISHADFSDVGRLVHQSCAEKAQASTNSPDDHAAVTATMTPLQMIQYARARGIQ